MSDQQPLVAPECYRHPGRESHIVCQRCERPICPDCMTSASVGFHCPSCVKEGLKRSRQAKTTFGGKLTGAPARVTLALIGVNLFVWLAVTVNGGGGSLLLSQLGLSPVGGLYLVEGQPTFVEGVAEGAYWQLATSMFTHVELWHIGFNMFALYVLGPQLEQLLGRSRFLSLYLGSGLVGSLAVYVLSDPASITVGASGAIFGLMGAYLVVALKSKRDASGVLTLLGINAVITVLGASFISWQGHLGGFVGGLAIAAVLAYSPRSARSRWQAIGLALIAALTCLGIIVRTWALL